MAFGSSGDSARRCEKASGAHRESRDRKRVDRVDARRDVIVTSDAPRETEVVSHYHDRNFRQAPLERYERTRLSRVLGIKGDKYFFL